MKRGLFITGTDTNIGKTVVSAALMIRYRALAPCYWKPVQTGTAFDDDSRRVEELTGGCEICREGVRLPEPLSPHLAARRAGVEISIDSIAAPLGAEQRLLFIEGAGGVLVPLNDRELMIDWIKATALPALVVARNALGTINHTLLTIEALRNRSIPIAGIVLVGEPNADHLQSIEHFSGVPVVAEMPPFESVERDMRPWATTHFDTEGKLLDE